MSLPMSLDELRVELDAVDNEMMALLSRRADLIVQVAELKKKEGIPVYIPERETAIMQRLQSKNAGPLPGAAIERIFRTIIEEMRKFEDERVVHEPS